MVFERGGTIISKINRVQADIMNSIPTSNGPEKASYWLMKKSQGLNAQEQQMFDEWLSDKDNQCEFNEMLEMDELLNDPSLFDPDDIAELL